MSGCRINRLAHRQNVQSLKPVFGNRSASERSFTRLMVRCSWFTGYTSITALNPRFSGICGSMADNPGAIQLC